MRCGISGWGTYIYLNQPINCCCDKGFDERRSIVGDKKNVFEVGKQHFRVVAFVGKLVFDGVSQKGYTAHDISNNLIAPTCFPSYLKGTKDKILCRVV